MMRALYSGVAGLKTQQTIMDVVGNNIANVNTVGYKAKRATAKDSFYQTLSNSSDATALSGGIDASQVGYGATLAGIDVLHTNGGYGATGNAMDLYISGDGYLITKNGNGQEMYTRVGITKFDGSGNLVDGNGNFIYGYPTARYQNNVDAKAATVAVDNMTINFGADNTSYFNGYKISTVNDAAATTPSGEVDLGSKVITIKSDHALTANELQTALRSMTVVNGTLPTSVDLNRITATGTGNLTQDTVFTDAVAGGDKFHSTGELIFETVPAQSAEITANGVTVNFGAANGEFFNGYRISTVKDAAATSTTAIADLNNKVITITSSSSTISLDDMKNALKNMTAKEGTGILPTSIDKSLITVSSNTTTTMDAGVTTIAATGGKDATQSTVLDKSNGLQKITKSGNLLDTDGDGVYDVESDSVMELTGIKVAENGLITGKDTNGKIVQIGQIVLANISNPSSLNLDGDGYLVANGNTGDITYDEPGSTSVGSLVSGGLENSNVDLANEFSQMIITQRGFQANSRIITVSDTMLEELINLKR